MFGTATAALGAVLGELQGEMSAGDLQQEYGDCRAGREAVLKRPCWTHCSCGATRGTRLQSWWGLAAASASCTSGRLDWMSLEVFSNLGDSMIL